VSTPPRRIIDLLVAAPLQHNLDKIQRLEKWFRRAQKRIHPPGDGRSPNTSDAMQIQGTRPSLAGIGQSFAAPAFP
jgi:hypothetical protein